MKRGRLLDKETLLVLASPASPAEVLRDYMETHELTARELARRCAVATTTITNILRERNAVTAEMALRFECVFERPALFWLMLQLNHDLDFAKKAHFARIEMECRPVTKPERKRA